VATGCEEVVAAATWELGDSELVYIIHQLILSYTVHPVPVPLSTRLLVRRRDSDGGNNQNLMLFIRGNAMSGAPSINGTNQFPNPPIIIGTTMKKIITKACAVTIEF
jgi:hypothetical protein